MAKLKNDGKVCEPPAVTRLTDCLSASSKTAKARFGLSRTTRLVSSHELHRLTIRVIWSAHNVRGGHVQRGARIAQSAARSTNCGVRLDHRRLSDRAGHVVSGQRCAAPEIEHQRSQACVLWYSRQERCRSNFLRGGYSWH